ncbi:MAG: IS4 family transposase [Bacteroidales bacterium]|nr:IS4 family transposase [Bacteroidales bacterium]
MCKDTKKNLVGQPIFSQIVKLLPRDKFQKLVNHYQSDRYYKTFFSWEHLVTMLYGVFSRCDSMGELCDSMRALGGNLNYLGLDRSPAKSTAGDALRDRPNELFRDFYLLLLEHFEPILSVSRIADVRFDKFYAFDSTTISLFSQVMQGVGRNRKDDGKKKGGLKVHMLTDAHSDSAKFAKISEAKRHDKNFLQDLVLPTSSMVVFDKAYNDYDQFAQWSQKRVWFVTRMKKNAVRETQDVMFKRTLEKTESGVCLDEHIHLFYKKKKIAKTLCLRKVDYRDEKGREYQFLTNNWDITAEEVALLYKKRWSIELVFKKLKQNFQLHFFWSDTENGIKSQVWATLIAHLLINVLKRKTKSDKAFSTIAALIRMHLPTHLDLTWLITESRRTYSKKRPRNKSPVTIQQELF